MLIALVSSVTLAVLNEPVGLARLTVPKSLPVVVSVAVIALVSEFRFSVGAVIAPLCPIEVWLGAFSVVEVPADSVSARVAFAERNQPVGLARLTVPKSLPVVVSVAVIALVSEFRFSVGAVIAPLCPIEV